MQSSKNTGRWMRSLGLVALMGSAAPVAAQDQGVSYTLYGTPGLLEMPSAVMPADGQITATIAGFDGTLRNSFTFQVTPRISGTFRYGSTDDYALPGDPDFDGAYYDRSFDLRFRIAEEGEWTPSLTIGLQDFLGTGQYGAEYIVATRTLGDAFRVTAGLGWGRLGTDGGLGEPFGERPALDFGQGGEVATDQFFRGEMALFGGVEWAQSERFTFKVEYSSDAYVRETELGLIERDSPLNFGVVYTPTPGVQLTGAYLYGSTFAFGATVTFNPADRPIDGGFDAAPMPVAVREGDARAALTWDRAVTPEATIREELRAALAAEGITLNAVELTDRTARVRYTNDRYRTEAQAMGRVARVLTAILPPSIEVLSLEPMARGIPMSGATFQRTHLETFEMVAGGTDATLANAEIADAAPTGNLVPVTDPGRFQWGIAPYFSLTVFDGDNPFDPDFGVSVSASYAFSPNLVLAGEIRKSLNPIDDFELSDSALPLVRTDGERYRAEGDGGIQRLTLSHYGRPGEDLFSRVTVGLIEPSFGGISTELLYSPVDTRWAVGGELNYVVKRDYDLGFGFQDYDVLSGHASLYYQFDNGFHGQVDVGRYLAGDWGATFALDREFENGWRVGAYVTFTDVDAEDFGEGSFDKGIRISIPLDYFIGTPTQRTFDNTLQSLARDGGVRLGVSGRLYDEIRSGQLGDLEDGFGRFWR